MFSQSPKKKLVISDGGSNGTTWQTNGGIMSGLARWKETRIRQEIYLEQLKRRSGSCSGEGFATPKPAVKANYNDDDDFADAARCSGR
jgi:hypothetical protein